MDFLRAESNPFVAGGLVLMLAGALVYQLKRLPRLVYDFVERFFILRIEVLDDDEAYQWMQVWLADRLQHTLSISVVTRRPQPHEPNPDGEPSCVDWRKQAVYFVPAVGTYFFWYQGRFVMLNRERQESAGNAPLAADIGAAPSVLRNKESFTLRICSRKRDLARQLLTECRAHALPDDGRLEIRVASYNYWSLGARIQPRPLDSVLLDGNQAQELLDDVREFLASRAWYQRIGVPYRRGYLLHGPPGNGKTSVVKALASTLDMSVYLLVLSDPDMSDKRINDLLARVPENNLILLEDIDCAFTQRKRAKDTKSSLTFSGLLNAMDGVASTEGRIIVMTTNHVDRLDAALIRPGRADVKLFFGNATTDQARRLFERFFPEDASRAIEFASRIEERRYSMAALQDYLMLYRRDADAALQRVDTLEDTAPAVRDTTVALARRLAAKQPVH